MAGYVKLEEGGKAEEAGDVARALDLYREALDVFREVQRDHPSWNPSLLTYRITYCEARISRLTGEAARKRVSGTGVGYGAVRAALCFAALG